MHSPTTFREHFPEFTGLASDSQIAFWFTAAELALSEELWRGMWDQGCELYVAHHIAIAVRDQRAAEAGGVPGQVDGPQTAKSVDKVSKSMDTGAVTHSGAGFWNMTSYGVRFYNLARIVGSGGWQL